MFIEIDFDGEMFSIPVNSNCKEENALKTAAAARGTVSPSVKKYNRGTN